MGANRIIILMAIVLMASGIYSPVSAKEIVVGNDSEANFRSVQEAVNSASPGDTIIVRAGTYRENIVLNVTRLTVRSELGVPSVLVEPLDKNESIFLIKADNVMITGFNITGAGKSFSSNGTYHRVCGIYLENTNNCVITGNSLFENGQGISLSNASYNTISKNLLFSDIISLGEGSVNNTLTNNIIEKGFILLGPWSSNSLITENRISNSTGVLTGISFACCGEGDVVSDNIIFNCSSGIDVYDRGIYVRNNTITDCLQGIYVSQSIGTGIYDNKISNCSIGISLTDAYTGIEILNNTITSSAECGVSIPDNEGGKLIYNNYFNNTLNIRLGVSGGINGEISGGNTWNSSLTPGANIVGGPFLGGNFWAKPDGTGFSQTCIDGNGDGICDQPYNITGNNSDYLPLTYIQFSAKVFNSSHDKSD